MSVSKEIDDYDSSVKNKERSGRRRKDPFYEKLYRFKEVSETFIS